jgi:3-hydroxy-9,10-secoandrosta-1,3,5(10)-triene-9,17-dione monooxygenase
MAMITPATTGAPVTAAASPDVGGALVGAAESLIDALAARADDAERTRRLPDDTIADLVDAGLIHMRLPTQLGGRGADISTETLVSAALARGCAATSWVRQILSGGATAAAQLPAEGVREVFGGESPPLVCGVTTLTGTAGPVDGGYLVNGSWGFASGCLHSQWAMVGVRTLEDDHSERVGVVCVPMQELAIKDTWHVAGLCATGSNTIVAGDVFVPEHRVLTVSGDIVATLLRSPQVPRFAVALLGTLLGAADGLLARVVKNAGQRGVSYFSYDLQRDSDALTMRIGEAAMRIDTAWLHTRRAVDDLMGEAERGPMSYAASTRGQADAAYAARLLRGVAQDLVSLSGASSFAQSNPMQRAWRDITVGSNHAMLNATASLELHGRTLLERPSNSRFWGPDAALLA